MGAWIQPTCQLVDPAALGLDTLLQPVTLRAELAHGGGLGGQL
jgi:hypothetical protein